MRMHHQTLTTFNDAVTYYFRNVVVGRASFTALDEREREKKEKREKAVGVPLAATIVPVAMADIRSIGRRFFPFFLLSSTDSKERKKKNYEMFMTDSLSDVKRRFVEYGICARLLTYVSFLCSLKYVASSSLCVCV
jgi:hypothetical protein